ncbi:MAG TPA: PASTA domain-containing protein, partial [Solirubrobacteraceae bacterium]|nr:PASTA domain-containing protein [Solirubrobacteraceae bacterium]
SSISTATQRLQSEGFEVQSVRDTSDKPRNTVIGQNPGPGSMADEGSLVTINVSEGPAITDVPEVVGLVRTEARKRLTAAGFEVRETRVSSDSVRVGRVVAQSPDGGSLAQRGEAVRIEVSEGPERLPVPDVVGRSEDTARSALDAFRVEVQEKEDDDAEPGTVLAQNPAGGTLPRGGAVQLTVAVEPKRIEVPDVVGRSQNNATKTLSGAGFEVAVEEEAVDSRSEDGLVQEQSPAAGRRVDRGSTVTITVGRHEPEPDPAPRTPTTPGPGTTTPAPRP